MTDDVAKVTSDVESVTEAATNALPSPPAPIETPGVPTVPVSPPPPAASKPTAPSAAPPAEHEIPASDLGEEAEGVVRGAPEADEPTALAAPGTRGEPGVGVIAEKGPGKRSIGPAEKAPLMRWRAYLWPAIALRVGDVLKPLLAPLDGLARVPVPGVLGLFSSPVAHGSVEIEPPAERSGLLGQNRQSPGLALPGDGMDLVAALLIGLLVAVGLVALARLVIGEELFESRYWRGHRG